MKIAYVFSQPRKSWEKAVDQKKMPDHVLYGMNFLNSQDHKIIYSDTAFAKRNLLKWPVSPLQQLFRNQFGVGFQLDQAILLASKLNQADVIVTTNDSCGLPVAFLKKIKVIKSPQIYFHIDFKTPNGLSKKIFQQLLESTDAIVCFSKQRAKKISTVFKLPSQKIHFIAPGVDTKFFKPKKTEIKYDVLSIGRDINRDYQTLFQAIKPLNITALVICDPKNIKGLKIPANVTIRHYLNYLKVKQAYYQSRVVVVCTKKHSTSGQISLLESLACGKPVVASNTKSLKSSFNLSNQTIFYHPENYLNLRSKLSRLLKDNLNQTKLSKLSTNKAQKFTSQIFAHQLNKLLSKIVV